MTLKFPPTSQSPWEAPNGAIYEWDGEKWIVKGAQSIYVKKEGDEMSGDLLLQDEDGNPAVYDDTTLPETAVNKKYVDEQDNRLFQGIIDLQEEIEAIAPSLEKGAWEWDQEAFDAQNTNRPPGEGKYYLLQGVFPTWTIVEDYILADAVVFNVKDASGTNHENWDSILGTEDNKLILLFDKPDPDKCLGKITDIYDIGEQNNPFGNAAIVLFNRQEAFGKPNNSPDENGKYITYVNIFEEPSGGTASEFVMKIGDTMSGSLKIGDANLMPDNANTNSPSLTFETKTSGGTVKSASFYSQANTTNIYATGALRAGSSISALGNFQYNGTTRIGCGIDSNTGGYGYLGIGTSTSARPLEWNSSGIKKLWGYNGQGEAGQVLKLDNQFRPYWGSSGLDISCSSSNRNKGDMWYCSTDQTLYIKVSD